MNISIMYQSFIEMATTITNTVLTRDADNWMIPIIGAFLVITTLAIGTVNVHHSLRVTQFFII